MRARCAVYVDAGYLLAGAATLVAGTSLRASVAVDHEALINGIIAYAEAGSELPLLRVSWYDSGARDGLCADASQEQIGELSRVKLRLGRRGHCGEPKGVDLRIGLDLATQAGNRAIDVAYLISGDGDLTEVVAQAQALGVELVILAVPRGDGSAYGVSRPLQQVADRLDVLPTDFIRAVTCAVVACAAVAPSHAIRPSPALLAARRSGAQLRTGAARAPAVGKTTGHQHTGEDGAVAAACAPTPDLTAAEQQSIAEVCRALVAGWRAASSREQQRALLAGRPIIPADIDRALLVDLSARVGRYDMAEPIRHALRQRFWEEASEYPVSLEAASR